MDVHKKLEAKKPYVYKDNLGLIAVGDGKVVRLNTTSCQRCERYFQIINNSNRAIEIREALLRLMGFAAIQVCSPEAIDIKSYLRNRSNTEEEQIAQQIVVFEDLYHKFVFEKFD